MNNYFNQIDSSYLRDPNYAFYAMSLNIFKVHENLTAILFIRMIRRAGHCGYNRVDCDKFIAHLCGMTHISILILKMEAVKKGLEISRKSIIDLMYEVGYADMKAFRAIFKKVTGLSPIEYRKRYAISD